MITNPNIEKQYPLGHYLAILSKAYIGALFGALESNALDRYYMVAQVLDRTDAPYTQQSLGNFLNVDKVTMVRIIDHLTERGIIQRVSNPADRREKFIRLTEKGQKAVRQIHEVVTDMNDKAMQGFTGAERDTFYRMMERMNNNLSHVPTQKIYLNIKKSRK